VVYLTMQKKKGGVWRREKERKSDDRKGKKNRGDLTSTASDWRGGDDRENCNGKGGLAEKLISKFQVAGGTSGTKGKVP